jgi:RNA polymerase sigma factor (TIGR02999 family)
MSDTGAEVTRILTELSEGDHGAADRLLPLVYDELRRRAGRYLIHERSDHTLQPTALVHEAYLKLVNQKDARWQDRLHFYHVAAEAMRRVLVNHAREHKRLKRGGGAGTVSLQDSDVPTGELAIDLLALDEALDRLGELDARQLQVAQLRYFGGFTIEETADLLGISAAQVKRDWTSARAFLLREVLRGDEP